MKVAFLVIDNREAFKEYDNPVPHFGTAPEALLEGFTEIPGLEIHIVSCVRQQMQSPVKLAKNIFFHPLLVKQMMRTMYWDCIRVTRKKLKEIQPDIVHGQGTERESGLCAAFSGFPNVITLHGIMREQAKLSRARPGSFYWLASLLEGVALRRTNGVFCNSEYTEKVVSPRTRKTWRVPNPLRRRFFDEPAVPFAGEKKPTLLNVGVVCPRKRQNELVAMARELRQEGLNFQVCFVGNADKQNVYGARFFEAVRQNPECAVFAGFKPTDELIRCFDASSALVHVPTEESFGLVVAEALARNLKFFGFKVGGINDIARGVKGAELFDDGDWAGLKEGIKRWLKSGAPRLETAQAAMAEKYHPRLIADRHVEIYQEVLRRSA